MSEQPKKINDELQAGKGPQEQPEKTAKPALTAAQVKQQQAKIGRAHV